MLSLNLKTVNTLVIPFLVCYYITVCSCFLSLLECLVYTETEPVLYLFWIFPAVYLLFWRTLIDVIINNLEETFAEKEI